AATGSVQSAGFDGGRRRDGASAHETAAMAKGSATGETGRPVNCLTGVSPHADRETAPILRHAAGPLTAVP
ncbi:hypothetical protein LG954_11090, partial [Bifidobacterium longum subsp. infantis]|nr:hypothetical protein [Bifidobacterium longum subsp. infantis]